MRKNITWYEEMGPFIWSWLWFWGLKSFRWQVLVHSRKIIICYFFFKYYFWQFWGKIPVVDEKTSSILDFFNFFFIALLVKTYESVHAKFCDFAMSQSRNIKFPMCYKKCVHTLSRLCHAVIPSIETRLQKLGKFALGMVWKSIKFCI